MSDPIELLTHELISRLHETAERLVADDLRLLGVDPDAVRREGQRLTRFSIVWQHTDPSAESIRSTERASLIASEMYRGLTLDGELVIDHLWQFPGAEKNRLRFVYFGTERNRMGFAREHSIDQRRLIHYARAEEKMRGSRDWLIPIYDVPDLSELNWHLARDAERTMRLINQSTRFEGVDRYGR